MNYYNEHDPRAAAWLRELIKANLIAPGEVDERDIQDVLPNELVRFTQCHFFAGIGVWSYALRSAGWPDDRSVWTGSCPCQPFSQAGERNGFDDERHLWPAFYWLISQRRPDVVFGEQVESKDGRNWLDVVQADMEAIAYAFGAIGLCAAGVGAPHVRPRFYFVGERAGANSNNGDGDGRYRALQVGRIGRQSDDAKVSDTRRTQWTIESRPPALAYGIAARVEQVCGYGNAIVAPLAEEFIRAYIEVNGGRNEGID